MIVHVAGCKDFIPEKYLDYKLGKLNFQTRRCGMKPDQSISFHAYTTIEDFFTSPASILICHDENMFDKKEISEIQLQCHSKKRLFLIL